MLRSRWVYHPFQIHKSSRFESLAFCRSIYRAISHYITTPIFYANSSPHIGHVHTLLIADALNIYQRLKSCDTNTLLSTGTDEHGIKIQTAAEANKQTCSQFCDLNSKKFVDLFRLYETTCTDFIRTTEQRHHDAVQTVWKELVNAGYIYKGEYSGWYCVSDETFVPESQVIKKEVDGKEIHLDQNDNRLIWSSEVNYMFRLSDIANQIRDWLEKEKPIVPEKFNDAAISLIKDDIGDLSISRPTQRLGWGIRVPDDESQTIYVWLDALTNYLTIVGYPCEVCDLKRWPIDCQIIGKDIIKFHAIYWPAFLAALSLPLPKRLICHSHWLIDSKKMSKSRGNVVDPIQENQLFSIEGLRYYLLRASTPHSDTDYSRTQAFRCVNAELADTYGNLLSRCCGKAINPNQNIPTKLVHPLKPPMVELMDCLSHLKDKCEQHYRCADFYKGINELMEALRSNNRLYQDYKPWKLVKEIDTDEESFKDYSNLQAVTFESLRICSILLQPIVPKLSTSALNRLNVHDRSWEAARLSIEFGDPKTNLRSIDEKSESLLFRRLKPI